MPRVEVRLLKNIEEYRECERIQSQVWGTCSVSSEVLSVTQRYGGVVLGALVGGKIVGFIYAFLARRKRRLVHWSHMMAVEPGFRDQGLGFRMKQAHRKLALERGIRSICWTYDPLQSRNATLNLKRLGGRCEEYLPDCYGHFPSKIEKGLPTDRFVVNWRIATATVAQRMDANPAPSPATASLSLPRVNQTRINHEEFIENQSLRFNWREPRLLVEIPANTDEMRERNLALARRWRMETRRIFTHFFAAGYLADGFIAPTVASEGRSFYVLHRLAPRP